MNRTDFANWKFVYNFHFIHFFCRPRFDNSKPFLKKKSSKVSMRSEVRAVDGISQENVGLSQHPIIWRMREEWNSGKRSKRSSASDFLYPPGIWSLLFHTPWILLSFNTKSTPWYYRGSRHVYVKSSWNWCTPANLDVKWSITMVDQRGISAVRHSWILESEISARGSQLRRDGEVGQLYLTISQ